MNGIVKKVWLRLTQAIANFNNFLNEKSITYIFRNTLNGWVMYLVMFAFILLSFGLNYLIVTYVSKSGGQYLTMMVAVLLSAWFGGFRSGFVVMIISLMGLNYFFVSPGFILPPSDIGIEIRSILFLIEGTLISWVSHVTRLAINNAYAQKEELEKKDSQLKLLVEGAKDYAIFMLDRNGYILTWNPGAANITGYHYEEIIGKHFSIFYSDEDIRAGKPWESLKKSISQGKIQSTVWHIRKDGSGYWANVLISPLKDTQGKIIGYSKLTYDMTKQIKNDIALRKSEEKFRSLSYNSPIGIILTDEQGNCIYSNPKFQSLFQCQDEEIVNRDWIDCIADTDKSAFIKLFDQSLKSKQAFTMDVQLLRDDEASGWIRIRLSPMSSETDENSAFVGTIEDITDEKDEQKRKDDFISIVSHELKTPLTSIKAFTQLLQKRMEETEDMKSVDFLKRMDAQLNRLTSLVQDLLDVSRIQGGKMVFNEEVFVFDDLVEEVIAELQPTTTIHQLQKKGKAQVRVYADKYRLGQVITNFLTNAIKYSSAGKILVKTAVEDDEVVLSVKDFGIGIPQEQLSNVFSRFYRIEGGKHAHYPGLGLGLFISAEIIKRHNGKIWVESEDGKGSTFYFSLPITLKSRFMKV